MVHETEELIIPDNLQELIELSQNLWYNYFLPKAPLDKDKRKQIMNYYNTVARQVNKMAVEQKLVKAGQKYLVEITTSTRWEPTPEKEEAAKKAPTVNLKKITAKPKPKTEQAEETDIVPALSLPGSNKIQQIIALHVAGKSNKEIIAMGFNKSTVGRQVSEYKKAHS